jgi:hypothetical protein
MKKILSMLLVAAMLISALCALAVVPASAAEGMWDTFGSAADYDPLNADSRISVPGYEYTEEGLKILPGDWSTTTIFGTVSSKTQVDLKDGVYMEIVVDDFSLENDRWLMFHLWSEQTIVPAANNEDYGYGIKAFAYPGLNKDVTESGEVPMEYVKWAYEYFTLVGDTKVPEDQIVKANVNVIENEDGTTTYEYVDKFVLELCVTWEGDTYNVTYNGAPAPEAVITYMNETFGSNSQAYVGFSFHNTTKGGDAEFTMTKFGTSKEDATTPMGDDSKEPVNYNVKYADIMDASTVPEGQPAIMMNANADSDIGGLPQSASGSAISVNGDYINVRGTNTTSDFGVWKVKSSVSYDVADFPVMMCVVKDLCTCGYDQCYAIEKVSFYPLVGDILSASDNYKIRLVEVGHMYPYIIENGEHAGS